MIIEREPFSPCRETLQMIESCASSITPDQPPLVDWYRTYATNHKVRIAFDLDIVKQNLLSTSKVLEFGSIPLLLTTALSKCRYDVTGCDLAPERFSSSIQNSGLNVAKCDIEQEPLPFEADSFDGIIFNELFEHLRINPIYTFREVFRVMKPGACLLLSSPNLRSLQGIINFILRNRALSCSENMYIEYKKLEVLGHMGHVREYTTEEIIEFLETIGFKVTKIIYRGAYNTPIRKTVIRCLPSLRPFVSYVAIKSAEHYEDTPLVRVLKSRYSF